MSAIIRRISNHGGFRTRFASVCVYAVYCADIHAATLIFDTFTEKMLMNDEIIVTETKKTGYLRQ